jgi:hypothetical protein
MRLKPHEGGSVVSLARRLRQWWQGPTQGEDMAAGEPPQPPQPPQDYTLNNLKRFGTLATGALAVVTSVLGVFGIKEGIPARILRDQPVATLISFLLIGLAILLAALSIFSFDREHPRFKSLEARPDGFGRRSLANGGSFFLSVFLALFVGAMLAFWVGGKIEEVAFSFPRRLLLALAVAALGAVALLAFWSAKPGDPPDDEARTEEASKRTRRMIVTSVVYFSLGLLLVAMVAVTSPGLTKRPRITVALEGSVLTTTIKGEDVGANRTYAIVVKLVSDAGEDEDRTLQQLQTGGDAEGKVDVTVKAALPAGRGGKVLVVAVPSERVQRVAATEPTATTQGPTKLDAQPTPTVDLDGLRECPGPNTVIACASIVQPFSAATQLSDVSLATASGGQPHTLKFKVAAGNLEPDERVRVVVTVAGARRVTVYDGVLPVNASGGFEAQSLTVEVPNRARRVCISARALTEDTGSRRGAVCPAAPRNEPGVASTWLRVPTRTPATAH